MTLPASTSQPGTRAGIGEGAGVGEGQAIRQKVRAAASPADSTAGVGGCPTSADTAQEFCLRVLGAGDLESKLARPRRADGGLLRLCPDPALDAEMAAAAARILAPARDGALQMQPGAERLPRLGEVMDPAAPAARVQCLARFAHHELQAIELMAWAVLAFPALPLGLRKALLLTLEEEQTHLSLYRERLAAYGAAPDRLGDEPLSDYLWQHRAGIAAAADPPLAFLCAVGLTFEQANLDFTLLYRDAFRTAGDEASARVLQRVHDDEIRHVRIAAHWLRRLKPAEVSEVAAYAGAVPFPLSAARAKGRRFDLPARRRAGLSDAMIAHVRAAQPYVRAEPQAAAAPRWLLPNLGAEENRPIPAGARGFLRGLFGAWAALFDARAQPPLLLPPGEQAAQAAWRALLRAEHAGPALALPCLLDDAGGPDPGDESRERPLVAWLGTAHAAAAAQAQRRALAGPAPEVVAHVHDKAFAVEQSRDRLPPELRPLLTIFAAAEVHDPGWPDRVRAVVAAWPAWARRRFTLKPRHGTSGRGRVMGACDGGAVTLVPDGPRVWADAARALAARGGCILEPWLPRTRDLSVQLCVHPGGTGARVELLGTTAQLLTPSGQILGNRGVFGPGDTLRAGAPLATAEDEAALADAATALGAAAAAAGFHGVAGTDAFFYRGPDGDERLRPVVELNARFTTGTVALGLVRLAQRAGLTDGRDFGAWALLLKAPRPAALAAALSSLPAGAAHTLCPDELRAHGPILCLSRDAATLDALIARATEPAP